MINLEYLGYQVKIHREKMQLTQKELANRIGTDVNRSNIAHLEQGRKLPYDPKILELICVEIKLPADIWKPFVNEKSILRLNFESLLKELVGDYISSYDLDTIIISVIEEKIHSLFQANLTPEQSKDSLNSILIYFGIKPLSTYFFDVYIKKDAFRSLDNFEQAIIRFQKDAIRLFSTISEAFNELNTNNLDSFTKLRNQLEHKNSDSYTNRTDWDQIKIIQNEDLPFLGYIAASKVRQEEVERKELAPFLREIANSKANKTFNIDNYGNKKKRRMDSLLRKFNSTIQNGLFSPLFNPDIETLNKEAEYIAPERGQDFEKMESIQKKAYHNLSNYLSADYLDVYVATSMRDYADFVSVNDFVENLFKHRDISQLKLRYFNPTQSWIEDRIAKGLVEALMLKRADICIYMAQKEDTFGKDSEASVTLGQGKPVIVYVPKLSYNDIDSEKFGLLDRSDLITLISSNSIDEIGEQEDIEALPATLLHLKLSKLSDVDYANIVKSHWADFNIEGEFEKRINDQDELSDLKQWFKSLWSFNVEPLTDSMRKNLEDTLVAESGK